MKWTCSRGRQTAASPLLGRACWMLAAAFALAIAGCHKPMDSTQDISVEESIAPEPVHAGEETVSIRLTDAARQPLSRARIQVEGDMDHPGMAPVFSDAEETAPGSYRAPLSFTMGGDWVVLLHIMLADGRKIEKQWNVKGVESR